MWVLKAIAGWFLILVCAVLNGAVSEFALVPAFGASSGLALSGLLLCAVILVVALLLVPWLGAQARSRYIEIGLLWLCLSVLFEFGFGRALGKSWTELLAAYSFQGGNLWPVVLVFTAASPALAARLRGALLKWLASASPMMQAAQRGIQELQARNKNGPLTSPLHVDRHHAQAT